MLHPPLIALRRAEVRRRTGLANSSLYDLIRRGEFPKPFRLSAGRVAWVEAEVDTWLRNRLAERSAHPRGAINEAR
jgi:prophage regulatory protein